MNRLFKLLFEATELVESGDSDAIIKIPKSFTHDMLSSTLLEKESETALEILAEEQSTELTTLQNILTCRAIGIIYGNHIKSAG